MGKVIAVASGKGGTGKTTFCGMLVRYLADRNKGHILAVDADPNSNLNEVLGVTAPVTLGALREGVLDKGAGESLPGGMSKPEYMEYIFGDALLEEQDFDLLVMGRTQGEGCYCYVNGILSTQIEKYSGSYSHIVVDNEAGLEHISRGTLPSVDVLLVLSDCSRRGIQAAGRIAGLVEELKLKPKIQKLIVNRAPDGILAAGVLDEIKAQNLDLLGILPQDEMVYRYDTDGKPSANVPDDSPIKVAVNKIIAELEI
jgi:CO dehydrogenase maturation factor